MSIHTLRRARSDGDVPQRQNQIHRPSAPTSDGEFDATNRELSSRAIAPLTGTTYQATLQSRSSTDEAQDPPNPQNPPHRPWYVQWMGYAGIGRGASKERRSLVALLLNLTSGSVQIIVITVILSLSGTIFKSPLNTDLTEWEACSRPLGIWASIWVARAMLACSLNYWGFVRERKTRERHSNARDSNSDTVNLASPSRAAGNAPRIYGVESSDATIETSPTHILEYSSINTCRHTSPHLWWLTFGILCLMYLMVLEVVVLGFVVFIIAPILFLFWNIVLICVGRHPLQNTNVIKPEISKLSKSIVDAIPLVIYIPPPPDAVYAEKPTVLGSAYPPKNTSPASKSHFRFIRRLPNFQSKKATKRADDKDTEKGLGRPQKWEDHWEQSDYPFVVLEGNRAACAICLMDFEEPKRLVGADIGTGSILVLEAWFADSVVETKSSEPVNSSKPAESPNYSTTDSNVELKLADAGEGSQPLRLLACGHVYHVRLRFITFLLSPSLQAVPAFLC
ncbi:hypothetical protein H0H81_009329 [Sphagnurus paluster]|uniref:Uncharacterized protein n=1 Tax=Sphagnurus paluster TaxID=117069 RepID=A0A9P7K4E1_9AGAR|nr:hypothetical protein H0H81_009329 [Sphagnurus paluster]